MREKSSIARASEERNAAVEVADIGAARRLIRIATAIGFGLLALLRYMLSGY